MQLIHDDAADTPNFPGAKATYTESMNFLLPDSYDGIPVYRVMDRQGNVINPSHDPHLPDDELLKMYKVRKTPMQLPLQETDWGFCVVDFSLVPKHLSSSVHSDGHF